MNLEWNPPIQTGLSGEKHPTGQIDPFIDKYDDGKQPGVYILRLSRPKTNELADHLRLWKQNHNIIPDYIKQIAELTGGILYVGAAESVLDRIETHLDKSVNKSASLMDTYPPHSIINVKFYDDRDSAFDDEYTISRRVARQYKDMYVHCR